MIILQILAIWFAISFGLLGAWILLCTGVRYYENVKNYKHVCYVQRRKELRALYRKDNDDVFARNLETYTLEASLASTIRRPTHLDGSRCFGNYCRCHIGVPGWVPGQGPSR